GETTMIFSIIVSLTKGLDPTLISNISILHPPFLLGLLAGGAMIYWFTGASTQAVSTGAYRAVEFIKANIRLEGTTKASVADSKRVVEICTQYAQKGMFNIFLTVFFATLAFAFLEPYFFIGYLISIALFGLYQAVFMANAGGAWDNAKKIVETELKEKGSALHAVTVVGDTVGDPFKDTSSVAMNPVIKFTTLFGLLAVAAVVGDSVGYAIGRRLGRRLFTRHKSLLFNPGHVERTRRFYEKYGAKTIVIARVVPIVRTFAPVLAGVGRMEYRRFIFYSVAGGMGWVVSMTWVGYLLRQSIPNIGSYIHIVVPVVIVL